MYIYIGAPNKGRHPPLQDIESKKRGGEKIKDLKIINTSDN